MSTSNDPLRPMAEQALAIYERVLAERPGDLHQPLTDATRTVIRLRDAFIERGRAANAPDSGAHLDRVNQIASLAFGSQFPVVGVKWQRIESTRDALKELLKRM